VLAGVLFWSGRGQHHFNPKSKIVLASAFTHVFTGLALAGTYVTGPMPARFWALSAACAVLPDADALGFYLGVPYGSMFGHRGFSHSLLFALILGLLVTQLFFANTARFSREWRSLAAFFFIVTASHPLLDMLTNGGLGAAIFSPFNNARYFFPWRPVQVSPIGVASFFTARGLAVITSELLWIWLPFTVVVGAASALRTMRQQ
jgi:inner membrane protein